MKIILFKIQQFPHLSETFVLAQVITAINAGFDVRLLVKEELDFDESTHRNLIDRYKIREKIILENYKIPRKRSKKIRKACILFLKHFGKVGRILRFYSLKRKFSLSWIYEFDFFYKFKEYHIIHVQYGTNVHPIDILKRAGILKGKLIVSFHGHDAFFPINGFIPEKGYYRNLFRGSNLIVANTPYLAEKIKELGCPERNLRNVPVGVDTNFFTPTKKYEVETETVKFINVSRLDKIKGHSFAIHLINRLKKQGKRVELRIVGDGKEKKDLQNLIKKLELESSVRLLGRKSQEEVRRYLRKSDVYILTAVPLKDGRRETQGLATLEAEASGLPVLAFDSGGVKYTIEDGITGFLCQEHDLDCLEKKGLLLMNWETRRAMGKSAVNFVQENFNQKKLDAVWEKIYNDATD